MFQAGFIRAPDCNLFFLPLQLNVVRGLTWHSPTDKSCHFCCICKTSNGKWNESRMKPCITVSWEVQFCIIKNIALRSSEKIQNLVQNSLLQILSDQMALPWKPGEILCHEWITNNCRRLFSPQNTNIHHVNIL